MSELTVDICDCDCGKNSCASTDPVVAVLRAWAVHHPTLRPVVKPREITHVVERSEPVPLFDLESESSDDFFADVPAPVVSQQHAVKAVSPQRGNLGLFKRVVTSGGETRALIDRYQAETRDSILQKGISPYRNWAPAEIDFLREFVPQLPLPPEELRDLALTCDRTYLATRKKLGYLAGHHTEETH